jgi:hypothetical protein
MEDFTLPSVGASFKKWECFTPILSKCQAHPHYTRKKKLKKILKLWKKGGGMERPTVCQTTGHGWRATVGCSLVVHGCPKLALAKKFLLPPAYIFFHMWSTLAGWLQHMLALPKLLLKFSNIHNFWSVGPKIIKFVLPQSLFRGAFSKKNS